MGRERSQKRIENLQFNFDGEWQPDKYSVEIGPTNYSVLRNMRYRFATGIESVSGYELKNTTPISTFVNLKTGIQLRTDRTIDSYVIVHATNGSGLGRLYVNTTDPPAQGDFDATQLHEDPSVDLSGRLSLAPNGQVAYCNGEEAMIWAGEEMRCSAVFTMDDAAFDDAENPVDYTTAANNTLTAAIDLAQFGAQPFMVVMTVRPAKSFKFTIETPNAAASTLTGKYYNGTTFAAVGSPSDGTSSGGVSMAQTGEFTFDRTVGLAEPFHYQGIYFYAYLFEIDAGTAEISNITVNSPWQDMVDLWDGVYRQPIEVQFWNATKYEDYTLQVNEASDAGTPIGLDLGGMLSTDFIIEMFEERTSAMRYTMLSGLINTSASVLGVAYWDGDSYVAVTNLTDHTDEAGNTLAKSGIISWSPPASNLEKSQTLFGTTGYAYKVTVSATLSGTKGSDEVVVDIITGIPAQIDFRPWDFSVYHKNRLMLGGYTKSQESNRMDFALTNAAGVFNGEDSSMSGLQSLYFGGSEAITCATSLYNRFGASIFTILLVLKKSEIYVLNGDSPDDFKIYSVSFTIGCPAPLTLVAAEIGFEFSDDVVRNVAMWVSYAGPMLFDGTALKPIKGVQRYFDPNQPEYCVNFEYIHIARGWFDATYKEYNIIIPSGTAQTTDNVSLVYNLGKRKSSEKDTGVALAPQCGFPVMDENGVRYIYCGLSDGAMVQLEYGPSWDGSPITAYIKMGDFWPDQSMWSQTLLRRFKVVAKKIDEAHDLNVYYYKDTELDAGTGLIWQDTDDFVWTNTDDFEWGSASLLDFDLSLAETLTELVRDTKDLNLIAWAHGFALEVSTTTTNRAFIPIMWGVQYEFARDDGP